MRVGYRASFWKDDYVSLRGGGGQKKQTAADMPVIRVAAGTGRGHLVGLDGRCFCATANLIFLERILDHDYPTKRITLGTLRPVGCSVMFGIPAAKAWYYYIQHTRLHALPCRGAINAASDHVPIAAMDK